MCGASNFVIGAKFLQPGQDTKKMNFISADLRLFIQAELRLSKLMRECKAIIYTLTEYEFLTLGLEHLTFLFTDQKPIKKCSHKNLIQNIEKTISTYSNETFKP